ncbi:hypothetical protein J2Z75_003432 [Rhizobium herbae]|uniref:HTH crp-type domain-containing protein n=1 Tax=Rhizobium herbae TaxID=508661 RepID=A0ABS4EQ24_9HYPH|nr:hypothetical protein [Rhizobium herbae]
MTNLLAPPLIDARTISPQYRRTSIFGGRRRPCRLPNLALRYAEMTGTALHAVSRILSAWEVKGFVEGGRQKLPVLNVAWLAALAGEAEK